MANINGTDAYLQKQRDGLEDLIEQEGMPTLWFSMSAADNHWDDFFQTDGTAYWSSDNNNNDNNNDNGNNEDDESSSNNNNNNKTNNKDRMKSNRAMRSQLPLWLLLLRILQPTLRSWQPGCMSRTARSRRSHNCGNGGVQKEFLHSKIVIVESTGLRGEVSTTRPSKGDSLVLKRIVAFVQRLAAAKDIETEDAHTACDRLFIKSRRAIAPFEQNVSKMTDEEINGLEL